MLLLSELPFDVLAQVFLFLDDASLTSIGSVNSVSRENLEQVWIRVAMEKWTPHFWQAAMLRDVRVSKPLPTWSREVMRLSRFEAYCSENIIQDYSIMFSIMDASVPQYYPEETVQEWQSHLECLMHVKKHYS